MDAFRGVQFKLSHESLGNRMLTTGTEWVWEGNRTLTTGVEWVRESVVIKDDAHICSVSQ